MDPHVSIKALLTGAAIAGAFAIARALQRRHATGTDGWRYLTPGPLMWLAVVGSFGFALLLSWVYLFVGSARADAATQMMYLFWLDVALLSATLFSAYAMIVEQVRWTGERIERRTFFLERRSLLWREITAAGHEGITSYYWLAGPNRQRLRFSPYSNGIDELMDAIGRNLPPGMAPPLGGASGDDDESTVEDRRTPRQR